jgi:limonene-1,2-epoxide hydrolase
MTTANTSSTSGDSTATRSAQQVVEAFVSALERLDYDAAIALVGDDIKWVNYPWTTSRNKRQFEKVLRRMFGDATRFEVQYSDIHERGNGVVYTDRVDIFEGGGMTMNLPVQGEFRVQDGRVVEWVDRFSWLTLIAQLGRSLPAILKHRLRS